MTRRWQQQFTFVLLGLLACAVLALADAETGAGIASEAASPAPQVQQARVRGLAITVHRHKKVQLLSDDFSDERLDDPAALAGFRDAARTIFNDTEIEYFVTMTGQRLESLREIRAAREVITLGGYTEMFVWPYRSKYFQHDASMVTDRHVEIISLSESPRVLELRNLLSPEECDFIRSVAEPELKKSTLVLQPDDDPNSDYNQQVRTSEGTFIAHTKYPIIVRVAERVANLTRIPIQQAEDMQVIHYRKGAHYHAHHDYLGREYKEYRKGRHPYDNRLATVLFYLDDTWQGGATVFPHYNPKYNPAIDGYGAKVCAPDYPSLKIYPRKGNAVLFYSMDSASQRYGDRDEASLHGGCDPEDGEKWAANYWLHNIHWHNAAPPFPPEEELLARHIPLPEPA